MELKSLIGWHVTEIFGLLLGHDEDDCPESWAATDAGVIASVVNNWDSSTEEQKQDAQNKLNAWVTT
jgi:hypothetical protein